MRIPRPACIALAAIASVILVSCGSSTSSDTPPGTPSSSVIAASEATTERFGTRTERNLEPNVTTADQTTVVEAMNDFSFDLHRQLVGVAPGEGAVSSGTRAAAVTLVATDESALERIAIDRPFIYALRDRDTGTVLFMGRVVAP